MQAIFEQPQARQNELEPFLTLTNGASQSATGRKRIERTWFFSCAVSNHRGAL
jgi:hypothetical protein